MKAIAIGLAIVVFAVTGYGWNRYHSLLDGLRRSGALPGLAAAGVDQNILIMGLDSRLDENGDPLPPELYQALDTGGADAGGMNANVLILLHVPGDGSRATAISIPRDDYVDLAGSPDGISKGKIKKAYGLAFDEQHRQLSKQGVANRAELEQRSRDAGRNAEITTVSRFLGGVPIDHFVEVTMVAFYQLAQVVQPITVCLQENTRDSYSGANFTRGEQQINAAQALAFVRQRRDYAHPQLNFTDLDRERRQQAFIASLAYQLERGGTLTDPAKLSGLINVARQNTAVDPQLDLLTLARQATNLTSGNVSFTTLPIDHFGKDPAGEDVNFVDPATVRSAVESLLSGTTAAPVPGRTVDLVNASGRNGLAAALGSSLDGPGDTAGTATTSAERRVHSVVEYAPGDDDAATAAAQRLGIATTAEDEAVPTGHLRVVLGTDFHRGVHAASSSPPAPVADAISGGRIPCVK